MYKKLVSAVFGLISGFPLAALAETAFLDQGWSDDMRAQFYHTPQGSHIMPADWFLALESPDGSSRFSDMDYLSRFGFVASDLPGQAEQLPVGIAIDREAVQVGLNCAACHTANVQVGTQTFRIDGAPARLDFDTYYQTLAQAVTLTLVDPSRFDRFAETLSATDDAAKAALKQELTAFNVSITGDAVLRKPVLESGFGRVDALTQIINALAVRDQELPRNLFPVASPTSYPPLWLTPELEFVQWNPIAASPILRNGGQVLGVFGSTSIGADAGVKAFDSTVRVNELHQFEEWVSALKPPVWDEEIMGPIDRDMAERGKALFAKNCSGCHNMAPYRRTDPADNYFGKTFIEIGRIDYRKVGTDPAYLQNLLTRTIATNATTAPLFDGAPMVPATAFFGRIVAASLDKAILASGFTQEEVVALHGYRFRTGEDGQPVPYLPPRVTDIKASPLAGVWATGPYFHNGSVPTVYEVLSPSDRRDVFWTGGNQLDLDRLGYESDEAPGLFRFDTSLPGNGNAGHDYGSVLSHDERMDVIEYLKTQ